MKKRIIAMFLAALALMSSGIMNAQKASAAVSVTVIVDDKTVTFPDAPAYLDNNGRTQIPTRYIAQALGAEVEWDARAGRATFSIEADGDYKRVDFYIGSDAYYIKNPPMHLAERHLMDTVATIGNSRTYVPARYLAEALGASVKWDSATKIVYITSASAADKADGENEFDDEGLWKAKYANEVYKKWFETLQITFEGDKVYLSYTIPDNVPDDADLEIALLGRRHIFREGTGYHIWDFVSYEMSVGDRAAGWERDYLIPSPRSGKVKKELKYIPFEDLQFVSISCALGTRQDPSSVKNDRYAQSSFNVKIFPDKMKESEVKNWSGNRAGYKLPDYSISFIVDGNTIVKFS